MTQSSVIRKYLYEGWVTVALLTKHILSCGHKYSVREKGVRKTLISPLVASRKQQTYSEISAVLFQGRIVAFMRLVWIPALPGALDCERGEEHDS